MLFVTWGRQLSSRCRQLGDDTLADNKHIALPTLGRLADMNAIHLLGKTTLAQKLQKNGGADIIGPGLLQSKNLRKLTNRNTLISHKNLSFE